MALIGIKHWFNHSGGKVLSGILIGTGILLMVGTTFLHKTTVGFVLGVVIVVMGLIVALLAFLAGDSGRQR